MIQASTPRVCEGPIAIPSNTEKRSSFSSNAGVSQAKPIAQKDA